MKEKITIAIYDENQLQKELLHHQFERMGLEMLYSTLKATELREYFQQRPADILMVNGANNLSKFFLLIKNLRKRSGKLKVILYNTSLENSDLEETDTIKGTEFFFTSGGWANLMACVGQFADREEKEEKKSAPLPILHSSQNTFRKISSNQKNIDILRYLKEGKSNRQIAYLLGTSINNVKYHLKKMHDETGSNTTKMVADAIKAGLI